MATLKGTGNKDHDWDKFDTEQYYELNYLHKVLPEDRQLGRFAINTLLELDFEVNSLSTGIDICNGGVLRGPTIIGMFVNKKVYWADYGEPQVQHAAQMIEKGKTGNLGAWAVHEAHLGLVESPQYGDLGPWKVHQDHLGTVNRMWAGGGYRACNLGEAVKQDILALPENEFEIAITCFGPESATTDHEEWEEMCIRLFRSVPKGYPVGMLYMEGSHGYKAGEEFPAIPITERDVRKLAKYELKEINTFFTQASHSAREEEDEFGYEGMGAVFGIRK